ncbi:hypothetical protein J6590_017774 [Homalodisca vitripennis]|nr:hypothetical protein J6590_017774 [Homalodisca vitripennis]
MNCETIILKTTITSLESKIEAMLTDEEKHLNQIERLQEKLEDTLRQLDKSKQAKFELQQIFEEHDTNQNQLIIKHLDKIHSLEKTNLALTKQVNHLQEGKSQPANLQTYSERETQTDNKIPISATSTSFNILEISNPITNTNSHFTSPVLLLELENIKKKQNIMECNLNLLLNQSQAVNSKSKHGTPTKKGNLKPNELNSKGNKSIPSFHGRNVFSVSLQMAKSKLRIGETNLTLPPGFTGGISQTPPEKPSQPPVTRETSYTTTELQSGLTGGVSQTLPEKLSQPPVTRETSYTTTKLQSDLTGGASQTPPEKLSQPPVTRETSTAVNTNSSNFLDLRERKENKFKTRIIWNTNIQIRGSNSKENH